MLHSSFPHTDSFKQCELEHRRERTGSKEKAKGMPSLFSQYSVLVMEQQASFILGHGRIGSVTAVNRELKSILMCRS